MKNAERQTQTCCPAVITHWRPQPVLESKFTERIAADNEAILNGLQALAENPGLTVDDMLKYVGTTYLRRPRFWTARGWVEGWPDVLAALKEVVRPGSLPVITSVSVLIEFQPYTGARTPAEDIDATANVRMTFSASPDGRTLEGDLKHSRVCEII